MKMIEKQVVHPAGRERELLLARRTELVQSFHVATQRRQSRRLARTFEGIRWINEFLGALDRIEQNTAAATQLGSQYAISSMFLHQCFRDLTADRNEQFFFVTGAEVGGVRVLDQKAEFLHTQRTMMGVVGNTASTHRLLIRLEQFGHKLLAHFHSHPGTGAGATRPSGTDENFQKRLEAAGYPTVAAIFSRDGYVRFFRLDGDFQIQIHGSGVDHVGDQVYRLTQIDPT